MQMILQGMINGLCDLEILMDPVFLHLPRPNEYNGVFPSRNLLESLLTDIRLGNPTYVYMHV